MNSQLENGKLIHYRNCKNKQKQAFPVGNDMCLRRADMKKGGNALNKLTCLAEPFKHRSVFKKCG